MLRNAHRLFGVHPRLCAATVKAGVTLDFDVYVAEGSRSKERQDTLYAQGRTAPGSIVTNATADNSPHCFGLAVDLYPACLDGTFNPQGSFGDRFEKLAECMKSIPGVAWGGDWTSLKDRPHFEVENWRTHTSWMLTTIAIVAGLALVAHAI